MILPAPAPFPSICCRMDASTSDFALNRSWRTLLQLGSSNYINSLWRKHNCLLHRITPVSPCASLMDSGLSQEDNQPIRPKALTLLRLQKPEFATFQFASCKWSFSLRLVNLPTASESDSYARIPHQCLDICAGAPFAHHPFNYAF